MRRDKRGETTAAAYTARRHVMFIYTYMYGRQMHNRINNNNNIILYCTTKIILYRIIRRVRYRGRRRRHSGRPRFRAQLRATERD